MRVSVRLVLLSALDDDAVRALREILPLTEEITPLDGLVPPAGTGPHSSSPPTASCAHGPRSAGRRSRIRRWRCPPRSAAACVRAPERRARRDRRVAGLVPYWIEHGEDGAWALAALPDEAVAQAVDAGIEVQRLPLDLGLQDPLFVAARRGRDASATRSPATRSCGLTPTRVLLALDAGTANDEIPAHGAHGHFRFLTPSPELLRARARAGAGDARRPARASRSPSRRRRR